MIFKNILRHLFLIPLLILCSQALADDPGITKVRLIQESDTSYLFELDIAAQYLWTLAPPILPEGFQVSDPAYEDQSGWITVTAKITSSGTAFSPADVIILPWQRAGADITVQWKDGYTYKGLYNRTLEGIHIPMKELMPVSKSSWEVLSESFILGLRHLPFKGIHVLLVFVLVWAFPSVRVFPYLFLFTLGQMLALVLSELGVPGPELLFMELLLSLLIFLLTISMAYKLKFRFLKALLFLTGVLHALSLTGELPLTDLEPVQRVQAQFAFNAAMDVGHYLWALVLLGSLPLLNKFVFSRNWLPLISGSLAVFLMLLLFSDHVVTGKARILAGDKESDSFTYKSYAPQSNMTPRQVQRGKGMMTTPLMIYLSIEPHEVRQEILILASEAVRFTSVGKNDSPLIPVETQETFKQELQDTLSSSFSLLVDRELLHPAEKITSFVTLGRGGVAIREVPVEETLDESILGITFIYDLEDFPDSINMDWSLYPESAPAIEASAVDPHGAFTIMLSPQAKTLKWKNRLSGYQVPAITALGIEKPARPLVSILLWFLLLVVVLRLAVYKKELRPNKWVIFLLVLSFVSYPFLRVKMDLPFLPKAKPSFERTETILNKLLSNTYRAFDRRNESDVYDLLAISVSGDQLTDIFMQNRQAMALENRGGARANVDEVIIKELRDFKRLSEERYEVDTRWTVRGSVNHFGHTHYRQNQYRALVSFGIEENSWKILNIEILDTRRLY
jgi:hypothetical protein